MAKDLTAWVRRALTNVSTLTNLPPGHNSESPQVKCVMLYNYVSNSSASGVGPAELLKIPCRPICFRPASSGEQFVQHFPSIPYLNQIPEIVSEANQEF